MNTSFDEARRRDSSDPLARWREEFSPPPQMIYVDGNSLGLVPRSAQQAVTKTMDDWRTLAVDGWFDASSNWFGLSESLRAPMAHLVGALPHEVIVTGTTTVNLHSLLATFYRPDATCRKIVANKLDFPSDIYALQSQIRLHGGDPATELVRVASADGRFIDEADLVAALADDVALLIVPSVLYRSGQLLDIELLTKAAHDREVMIGVDAAHSVGAVPHSFHEWGVDFAFWCTYKYLNAGPAAPGALFVHERHHAMLPGLSGWWGCDKDRQFEMAHEFHPATDAGRWQISAPPIVAMAPLAVSLRLFDQIGIDAIREGSLARTDYLIHLIEETGLLGPPYCYRIGTPVQPERRGGHVAVEHEHAEQICKALRDRGIVPDFRHPNIIRIAPVALYNTYEDCWEVVRHLKEIVEEKARGQGPG